MIKQKPNEAEENDFVDVDKMKQKYDIKKDIDENF